MNGATSYMYWNTSLKQGGISTWGWKQNSLVSVDTVAKTYKYNFEYYLMKHLSHFVKPGAKRLQTTGEFNDALVFINPDKSIVAVVHNNSDQEKDLTIKIGKNVIQPRLTPHSFNSIWIGNQEMSNQ
jgi:glucosylceramidase